jgi:hypothetical protein
VALAVEGKPNFDYGTHMPHIAERTKLRHIVTKYGLYKNLLTWEVLYGNEFHTNPEPVTPFLKRFAKQTAFREVSRQCKDATVLNHDSTAWGNGIRKYLSSILPYRSVYESAVVEALTPTPTISSNLTIAP